MVRQKDIWRLWHLTDLLDRRLFFLPSEIGCGPDDEREKKKNPLRLHMDINPFDFFHR